MEHGRTDKEFSNIKQKHLKYNRFYYKLGINVYLCNWAIKKLRSIVSQNMYFLNFDLGNQSQPFFRWQCSQ